EARESSRSHRFGNAEIYNSLGQLVKTLQISNNLTVINVKDFAKGMYQIKIVDGNGNILVSSFEKL
ncbi:MAG: T9SS type A sorting domain-containing protein, partial [Clostridia bacterium]|nr:T9SS type A sorting domain-containing protein [Clostridia bacterium]